MSQDPVEPKIEEVPLSMLQQSTVADMFQDPVEPKIEEVPLSMPQQPTVADTFQDPTEPKTEGVPLTECATIGPMDVNPFGLTNDEIDELLKGLEGIGNRILKEESGASAGRSSVDTELDSVLNMCVEDYIV